MINFGRRVNVNMFDAGLQPCQSRASERPRTQRERLQATGPGEQFGADCTGVWPSAVFRANFSDAFTSSDAKSSEIKWPLRLASKVLEASRCFCNWTSLMALGFEATNGSKAFPDFLKSLIRPWTAHLLDRLMAVQLLPSLFGPRFLSLSDRTNSLWRLSLNTSCQTVWARFASSARGVWPKTKTNSLRLFPTARRLRLAGKMRSDWLNKCSVPHVEKHRACQWATNFRKLPKCFWPALLPLLCLSSMPSMAAFQANMSFVQQHQIFEWPGGGTNETLTRLHRRPNQTSGKASGNSGTT